MLCVYFGDAEEFAVNVCSFTLLCALGLKTSEGPAPFCCQVCWYQSGCASHASRLVFLTLTSSECLHVQGEQPVNFPLELSLFALGV